MYPALLPLIVVPSEYIGQQLCRIYSGPRFEYKTSLSETSDKEPELTSYPSSCRPHRPLLAYPGDNCSHRALF